MRRVLAGALLALTVAACGSGSPAVSDAASTSLQARVAEIRQLVAGRQGDAVAAKLTELRAEVDRLRSAGEVSDAAAKQILESAAAVERQVGLITTTTTTPPPTTAAPAPPVAERDRGEDRGKNKEED